MERKPFQPASIKEATEGMTSIKDDFPNGMAPTIQVSFWTPTVVYIALGIAIAAIVIAVVAILKNRK